MHRNEKIIRRLVDHFIAGNIEGFVGMLTDDVVVHVPAGHQLSGDYKGPKEFVEKFVGRVMELTGGVQLEKHDILASDDHAVGLYTIRTQRNGISYEWQHVNVYHVRDGKVAEFWWTPFDQPAVSRLFAS